MLALKVLAFDTGGTILDWHGGLVAALRECGARCGVERPWPEFANEYRRRALGRMVGTVDPAFNIDDVHREVLDALLAEERVEAFSPEDRRKITQRWHELNTWPDFAPALVRLARAVRVRLVHDPKPVTGHRRCAPQRHRLGCGDSVRDAEGL